MSSEAQEWKLTPDEAHQYADKLRAMAASTERRALLAQELEACALVIVKQAAEIEQQDETIEQLRKALVCPDCGARDRRTCDAVGHLVPEGHR